MSRRCKSTAGITDGNIIATIITAHMTRNIVACASSDCCPMLIHAIDMDHPPGIGIVADIALAEEIVYAHAAMVTIAGMTICVRT